MESVGKLLAAVGMILFVICLGICFAPLLIAAAILKGK